MTQPPCVTDRLARHRTEPTPYDVLIDARSGPAHRAAVAEARAICGRCPLAQMQACYKAHRGEQWVRAIVGAAQPPTRHNTCGKPWGGKVHARHGEKTCSECKAAAAEEQRRARKEVA